MTRIQAENLVKRLTSDDWTAESDVDMIDPDEHFVTVRIDHGDDYVTVIDMDPTGYHVGSQNDDDDEREYLFTTPIFAAVLHHLRSQL